MKAPRKRTKKAKPVPLGLQAVFAAMQNYDHVCYFGHTTPESFMDVPLAVERGGHALKEALQTAANRELPGNNNGPEGDQSACEVADVIGITSFWAGVTACWHYMNAINGKAAK